MTEHPVLIHLGDCRDILAELEDASVDSIVTDPPYELGFMGKKWDGSGIAFDVEMWEQCLRVLKPGGHLLAFGGSRTWHRLTVAIEDAGFEIRDSIAWLYGSGFPKSLDVSKAIDKAAGAEREVIGTRRAGITPSGGLVRNGVTEADKQRLVTAPSTDAAKLWQGWGTALKPAFEPIVVARKPLVGTVAANVLEYGTGALNIDACRIPASDKAKFPTGYSKATGDAFAQDAYSKSWTCGEDKNPGGRWPTNVVLDDTQAAELDAQTGIQKSGTAVQRNGGGQKIFGGIAGGENSAGARPDAGYNDEGGASRFFPVFKYQAKAPTKERPSYVNEDGNKVVHSTVKPLALMRWLVKLVTPPGGVVLDPFAGSGTTVEACLLEKFRCIAIENEPDYIPLIEQRLERSTSE
ncbi:DNA methylase [Mycobacterium phage Mindy]|uniref:DNA methylase n=2 Tax=Kostyavirus toto TaxID=1993871 RepID=A0A0H4TI18_9CAUD|nr:DNA methyltransferase [Mycobacterium phage Dusk]YP_009225385.1 DNA methyltransferase [Mycobacterium phage Mindy]AGR48936.1 DNA methylase [Mycobacterium phage ABCat]AMS01898.1 DNA methylase [Mycobacterium phage TeardropMSU]APC44043.1 DNA methylase [Mycobacterium phage Tuco]AVI04553.1 DNA methylase [Mycobacterium phage Sotrice96]QIQ63536.1 DNA methylase [Mycobacterium phage BadStone]